MSATKSEKCRRHYRAAALGPLTLKRLRTSHRTKARTDAELSATDCYVDRAELSAQGRKQPVNPSPVHPSPQQRPRRLQPQGQPHAAVVHHIAQKLARIFIRADQRGVVWAGRVGGFTS